MTQLKHKPGDTVILNERFGTDAGKKAIVHSIETDKKGNSTYRLTYKGKLDPWNWKDSDFEDNINK